MDNQAQTDQPFQNPLAPQNQDQASPSSPEKTLSKTERLKRSFFQILIGCLIGAASIAVIAVLFGSFNDIFGRALGTIAMVALHATVSFGYIAATERSNQKDGGRSIELFSNLVFTLIVISFITSLFAIWQLLGEELTVKLYLFYGVILFATLHTDVLYRIRGFEKRINNVVTTNYGFITIVVTMLSVVIFSAKPEDISEFFYRVLAAAGIVDATLTISAVIMHRLYLQKHPQLATSAANTPAQPRSIWKRPLVILVLLYLAFQVFGSLLALIVDY